MYREKYMDPEPILENLSKKFGIKPNFSGCKIKVFIQKNSACISPSLKKIYAWDKAELRHELTHLLFYQLNKQAPFSLREGIAIYGEVNNNIGYASKVKLESILDLEKAYQKIKSLSKNLYRRRPTQSLESKLYSQGFSFVNFLIRKKGIEVFKEFYKKCKGFYNIKEAYQYFYKE